MLGPVLEELSAEVDENISIFKVDIDESQELALRYGVSAVPTMKIFKNGEEADTIVGFKAKKDLEEKLNYYNN